MQAHSEQFSSSPSLMSSEKYVGLLYLLCLGFFWHSFILKKFPISGFLFGLSGFIFNSLQKTLQFHFIRRRCQNNSFSSSSVSFLRFIFLMMWWCFKAEGEIENDDVVGENSLGGKVLEQHG